MVSAMNKKSQFTSLIYIPRNLSATYLSTPTFLHNHGNTKQTAKEKITSDRYIMTL